MGYFEFQDLFLLVHEDDRSRRSIKDPHRHFDNGFQQVIIRLRQGVA